MKKILTVLCLGLVVPAISAQETNEVQQLRQYLKEMQERFEKTHAEDRALIDELIKKVGALTGSPQAIAATNSVSSNPVAEAERKKLEQELAAELPSSSKPAETKPAWSPSQPLTVARAGSAYMNISFDTLMVAGSSTASDPSAMLELGDHDPAKRGFSLRNAEIAVDGAVDPYLKGFGNIVLKLDNHNQTEVELEEAYLLTTSLPANLQIKAGQFFAAFGRQNSQHPHQWAFVDAPIILNRAFGPDGLRSIGEQTSWLLPLPFFTELSLGVFDGQGGTAFGFRNPGEPDAFGINRVHGRATLDRNLHSFGDLIFAPRLSSSFDLSDEQTLVVGASAAFGPNDTGSDKHTQIYGADVYWKWKPKDADAGFPFVSSQTEFLYEHFEAGADSLAGLPAETLNDWGFYSQVLWGFHPRWVAGARGEYANGNHGAFDANDVFRGERTRVSPNLTFFPSEFSKVRLQYNYDHGALFGDAHSVWLQLEFLLGAHGAHKF